ncbi:MAG: hypothetical protein R3E50_14710 [Halioglobus sp.]
MFDLAHADLPGRSQGGHPESRGRYAQAVQQDWPDDKIQFLGAAGSAGFEAATNMVVAKANQEMLYYVYTAVILLCLLTFRSIPGVICAVIPLMLTSGAVHEA